MLVRVALHLVGELITRSATSGAGRITALDHEIGQYPMKDCPVIKFVPGQEDKVVDRVGSVLGKSSQTISPRDVWKTAEYFLLGSIVSGGGAEYCFDI